MVGGIENEGESMPRTRKNHPPSLKAKVAVEAIKAIKTTTQIAQMFRVHPTRVGGWKKQATGRLAGRFLQWAPTNAPGLGGGEGRSVQADRPNESGVGLSQKKSWPHPLTTNGYGSTYIIGT